MLAVDCTSVPALSTGRLHLRALRVDDVDAVFALRSDPVAMKYVPRPLMLTLDDAVAHIATMLADQQASIAIQWAISLKPDPAMIGIIGFWRMKKEHHRCELGYMLLPSHWGRGIITEAIAEVVDHAFSVLGFHSVEAITDPGNTASMKVLERNGFVKEGHFKENFHYDGQFLDSVVYSRLATS